MRRPFTKKPSPNWGPVRSTAKHSQGSKNFYQGLKAEETVVEHFRKQNWKLHDRRARLFGVEIDLIFFDLEGHWRLVEVKALQSIEFLDQAFSKFQRNRYRRVLQAMFDSGKNVKFTLVIVSPDQKITEIQNAIEFL